MRNGFVSLVGAGPGDPELISVKGLRRLREADVVVHDALIASELLAACRPGAEIVDAGKRAGCHSRPQEWINQTLVQRASAGLRVVRLKGGDPFVFGRGGEEAEALVAAGLDWEVVPGVSSAIAAPAYAGIPLTHRAHAASFAVISGHEPDDRAESRLRWAALARGIDTLVFLMCVGRLPTISAQLVAHGRPADTPAALVRWGSTAGQETLVTSLGAIAEETAREGVGPPALLVVGEVVRLRESLTWFGDAYAGAALTAGAES
jgi:uroporphyrin-III C-methyltransferase